MSRNALTRGAAIPTTRIGHSAAIATSAVKSVCCTPDVAPNRERTAHPKIALRIFVIERPSIAISAWSNAMPDAIAKRVPPPEAPQLPQLEALVGL